MNRITHKLKTHPPMFRAARDGRKTFEVRKDDRAYQAGDFVTLEYYDPAVPSAPFAPPPLPTTAGDDLSPITFQIGFVLRGGQYGIEPGYVVFSLVPVE